MKVGARITAATSALVAVTLGAYALFDLRAAQQERHTEVEREARDVANALRASIEARGVDRALGDADFLAQQITKAGTSWEVIILPRSQADAPPPPGGEAAHKRLQTILEARPPNLVVEDDERYVYAVPLREPSARAPAGYEVAGALELSRSTAHLDAALWEDLEDTAWSLAIITALTVLAIYWLTRSLVTQPIEKLLSGIDDVAHGDLSRVLLSERDDEIGALATRFNEMTFSLRESRAETQRQNDAKLQLEQRLSQTEKLATIGQLAAEIGHEVGTPLNVIAGRARTMAKKAHDPAAVEKNAGIIAEQSARITRIIQRLLDFTRRKAGLAGPTPVNLNQVTLTTMDFLEGQFHGAGIKTSLARAEGLPPVMGDPDRLQQVLINLLLNAIQAMPDGGRVEVETSAVTRRRPGLEMAPEAEHVRLQITDSGIGIPPDQRDKIFEPFYTSKEDAGGTGLGLSVCYGIVKDHDGWIEIDDARGGGTVFRVFLPAAEPDAR